MIEDIINFTHTKTHQFYSLPTKFQIFASRKAPTHFRVRWQLWAMMVRYLLNSWQLSSSNISANRCTLEGWVWVGCDDDAAMLDISYYDRELTTPPRRRASIWPPWQPSLERVSSIGTPPRTPPIQSGPKNQGKNISQRKKNQILNENRNM